MWVTACSTMVLHFNERLLLTLPWPSTVVQSPPVLIWTVKPSPVYEDHLLCYSTCLLCLQITEQTDILLQKKLQPYKIEIADEASRAEKLVSEFQTSIHTPAVVLYSWSVLCVASLVGFWDVIGCCRTSMKWCSHSDSHIQPSSFFEYSMAGLHINIVNALNQAVNSLSR